MGDLEARIEDAKIDAAMDMWERDHPEEVEDDGEGDG